MKFFKSKSLKFKLFFVLLTLTSSMLVAYSLTILRHFEADKIAYVYDAASSQSRSTASQIRSELNHWAEKLDYYMRDYNYHSMDFRPGVGEAFARERVLENVSVFAYSPEEGNYLFVGSIQPGGNERLSLQRFYTMVEEARENEISIRRQSEVSDEWWLALRYEVPGADREPIIVLMETKGAVFLEAFTQGGSQDLYLLQGQGEVVMSPAKESYPIEPSHLRAMVEKTVDGLVADVAVGEAISSDGQTWYLSVAAVGAGNLKVVSLLPKSVALSALRHMIKESFIFLVLLLSIAVIVSVVSSSKLTTALKDLLDATKKVGQGDFDASIQVDSEDEVGGLAKGFNQMIQEIKRLLEQTAEKARMSSELNTAKVVQATLFPASDFDDNRVSLRGYYRPASECGGDWWFYNQVGEKIYFWIGDATGHGAAAALLTSAARSAFEVIRQFPETELPAIMSLLNKAVHGVGKGEMMMTFFIASFDPRTGKIEYSSASHDPPFVLRSGQSDLRRQNVEALYENQGPRLGENQDSRYSLHHAQLNPGDQVIFYTDGVTEMLNEKGRMWGERMFLNTLIESFKEKQSLDATRSKINQRLEEHRGEAPLEDDITYFIFQYQESA